MRNNAETKAGRLILICGLVGAGKTTLARRLAEEVPAVRFCPDEWLQDLQIDLFDEATRARLEKRFKELAYELLKHGQNVILEFGFWDRAERDEIREAARAIGANVELRFLDVPADELHRRVQERNSSEMWKSTPIQREHMEEWATHFEPPSAEELALFDSPSK
jgi:predicted kinase